MMTPWCALNVTAKSAHSPSFEGGHLEAKQNVNLRSAANQRSAAVSMHVTHVVDMLHYVCMRTLLPNLPNAQYDLRCAVTLAVVCIIKSFCGLLMRTLIIYGLKAGSPCTVQRLTH